MSQTATDHYRRAGTGDASPPRGFSHCFRFVSFLALLAASPAALWAAGAPPADPDPLQAAIITIGVGPAIEERFGHNAIWIIDRDANTSIAYNFGVFSFDQHNFVLRFLQGRMDYWLERWDPDEMIEMYAQGRDRTVQVQALNLSPRQKRLLQVALEYNALPANRTYRYDYYTDNCSTRVRDAIDRAVGGQISSQLRGVPTGQTYRTHTRRLVGPDPLLYPALYFVLGHKVDQPIDAWQESFLPMQFQEHLRKLSITDEIGRQVPIVLREYTIHTTSSYPEPRSIPNRWWAGALAGLLIGAGLAGLAWRARRGRGWRIAFASASALWLLLAGFAGTFLAGVWAFTSHDAVYFNENLFQFNPLLLPMIVLVPALVTGRRRPVATRTLAIAIAGLALLGLGLKAVPPFGQVNWDIIALAVPAHAGLLAAVWMLSHPRDGDAPAGGAVAAGRSKGT